MLIVVVCVELFCGFQLHSIVKFIDRIELFRLFPLLCSAELSNKMTAKINIFILIFVQINRKLLNRKIDCVMIETFKSLLTSEQ